MLAFAAINHRKPNVMEEYLSALKHASTIAFAYLKFVSSVPPLNKSELSISIPL